VTEVRGGRETLAVLRGLDKQLYYSTLGKVKREAKPLVQAIDGAFPGTPPTRGMDHNGRTGWGNKRKWRSTVKVGGRRTKSSWPLVRVAVNSGPKVIADMAGHGQLAAALGGSPSRYVWPAANAQLPEVTNAVEAAVRDASKLANRKLERT
jgi:hypothetical protein